MSMFRRARRAPLSLPFIRVVGRTGDRWSPSVRFTLSRDDEHQAYRLHVACTRAYSGGAGGDALAFAVMALRQEMARARAGPGGIFCLKLEQVLQDGTACQIRNDVLRHYLAMYEPLWGHRVSDVLADRIVGQYLTSQSLDELIAAHGATYQTLTDQGLPDDFREVTTLEVPSAVTEPHPGATQNVSEPTPPPTPRSRARRPDKGQPLAPPNPRLPYYDA